MADGESLLLKLLKVHLADRPPQTHTEELLTKLQGLVTNLSWSPAEVIQLFTSLLKRFDSKPTEDNLPLWTLKMLHCVEINYITPNWKSEKSTIDEEISEKTLIELILDTTKTDKQLSEILGANSDKGLDEIISEIEQQNAIDKKLLNDARQIVLEFNSESNHKHKLTSVLRRLVAAVEKTMKISPRLTQMVSWTLMALSAKGRLIQVSTGEGKTCIIAMFAAFRALQRDTVDVMSSSPVLAERDFNNWKDFYKELKIEVSCNVNKGIADLKECYDCQVVYGTAQEFAADWLRQDFGRKDIRAHRSFQCAVVDEVDSLMLDKGCHSVYLGSEMPALQHLNAVLAHIWHNVNQYTNSQGAQSIDTDEQTAVKAIKEKITSILKFTPCDVRADETCCYVPGFFKEFVEFKLEDWIKKAFTAQDMTKDHEYVIERHGVVPVDFSCTGVLENSMEWTDGLHQFLQMKHQHKLTDMSAVTNFMSNVGLLHMYGDQIYGVTGTLGQEVETETLQNIYNGITTCYIPTFKRRKLFEEQGVIFSDEDKWLQKICEVIKVQTDPTAYRKERAVLVICETIKRAKTVHQALENSDQNNELYISNNMDNEAVTNNEVTAGNVIIATNLAGRGTDLKVSDSVNSAGGLFVLQTFLPLNARVEAQAFGRTGRQGKPGSAQLIICSQHLPETLQLMLIGRGLLMLLRDLISPGAAYRDQFKTQLTSRLRGQEDRALSQTLSEILTRTTDTGIELTKKVRYESVAKELKEYLEDEIPQMKKKQELFSQYLNFFNDFYKNNKDQPAECDVSALHEFWALWLLMNEDDKDLSDAQKRKLSSDLERARDSLQNRISPLSNLHHYTLFGNKLLEQGHFQASIQMYSKAIEQDHCWAAIAFYNRAFARLSEQDDNQDPECIEQALGDLQRALKSVGLYCLHQLLVKRYSKAHMETEAMDALTRFDHHNNTRCKVFWYLSINIKEAIKKLTRARSFGGHVKVEKRLVLLLVPIMDFLPSFIHCIESLGVLQAGDELSLMQLFAHHSLDIHHELQNLVSLGLTVVFELDTRFSLRGFFSKVGRAITQ